MTDPAPAVPASSSPAPALRRTSVHPRHVALGAVLAPFGGWEMPVSYAGTVGEHAAVREAVGVFDVGHLGKALVRGPGAAAFVDRCLTASLGRISPGQAQYTLCCAPDGGVVDDLIAYLVTADEVFLVPNAANSAAVVAALAAAAPGGVAVTDEHTSHGVLAVQGPRSSEVLDALGLPSGMDYMAWADAEWDGRPVRVCRTGYTGERGYELLPAWDDAPALFDALLDEAGSRGGQPCGLGARDTLRTEMGYPLHGHELGLTTSPLQARSAWAVGWDKPEFFGREALLAERAAGPARRMWGLRLLDRGVARDGMTVLRDGGPVGTTTSGTFSPTLKVGIALALLDTAAGVVAGDEVGLDVRGRTLRAEVVAPPFVPSRTR